MNHNPTCHLNSHGHEEWRLKNDDMHRLDGPAYVGSDGYKAWYVYGKRHREDGPAIEHLSHTGFEYYLHNVPYVTIESWAYEVLRMRKEPTDHEAVQNFIRSIMQKQTKELI